MKKITSLLIFLLFINLLNAQEQKEYHKNGKLRQIGKLENGEKQANGNIIIEMGN